MTFDLTTYACAKRATKYFMLLTECCILNLAISKTPVAAKPMLKISWENVSRVVTCISKIEYTSDFILAIIFILLPASMLHLQISVSSIITYLQAIEVCFGGLPD